MSTPTSPASTISSMKPILKQAGTNILNTTPFFITRGDDDINNNKISSSSSSDFKKKLELERISLLKSIGNKNIKNNTHEKISKIQSVDKELDITRENYEKSMKYISDGQNSFKMKQTEMKSTILQCEKFIVDQDNKINKADKTIDHERRLINQYNVQLMSQLKILHEKKSEKKARRIEVHKLQKYRDFLLSALKSMPDSTAVENYDPVTLIKRYDLLNSEKQALEARVASTTQQLEAKQAEYAMLKKSRMNEILMKNSMVAMATTELEHANAAANETEQDVENKDAKYTNAATKYSQMQMVILNLHNKAADTCVALKRKDDDSTTSEQKIVHLKNLLNDVVDRTLEIQDIINGYSTWKKKNRMI